jgi:parallel beta-helix repeat protein
MRRCLAALVSIGSMVLAGLVTASGADAAVIGCGTVITQSVTLAADVGPCAGNGIVVGADNITLDLANHTVSGTPASGDGAGVLLQNRHGVTVKRGVVTQFDGGVVILGGGGNTVSGMVATRNFGASEGHTGPSTTNYGDGILVQASSNNSILRNLASDNGPFSGIGVIMGDSDHPGYTPGPAAFNLVQDNSVINNTACRKGPFCDNDGIRLEPGVTDNRVIGNYVHGNGLDGISLFGGNTRNLVQANSVDANGFMGAVPGDGIRVFGFGNTIQDNSATGNAAAGVSVARRPPTASSFPATNPNGRGNVLRGNVASDNRSFDLWDSNPGCDSNVWSANSGQKVAPPCTLNP